MAGNQKIKRDSKFLTEAQAIALELGSKNNSVKNSSGAKGFIAEKKSVPKKSGKNKSKSSKVKVVNPKRIVRKVSSSKRIVLQEPVVSSSDSFLRESSVSSQNEFAQEEGVVSTKTVTIEEVSPAKEPILDSKPFSEPESGLIEMVGGLTMVLILFELIVVFILLLVLFLK